MYRPDEIILKRYADILIKYALNSGQGVKPGEVVLLAVPELAKPLLWQLELSVLEAGAHPMIRFLPQGDDDRTYSNRLFYEHANEQQLTFFPDKALKGLVDQVDHWVSILAEDDLHALEGIDSRKLTLKQDAYRPLIKWRTEKEYAGKLTWTLALYGTPAMAKEAGMSLEEYWQQIIQACFLDQDNPISQWQAVEKENKRVRKVLNQMKIVKLHITAPETDLWIGLGDKRRWMGGSGRNIPSFEIFTSPDWRLTEGKVKFNQPLYALGQVIKDVYLEFKQGIVVQARASQGQKTLQDLLKLQNADKVGEFSLTDKRMSRITRFMANTLYDENIGGPHGNMHLAVGKSYQDTYDGDPRQVSQQEWQKLGFNLDTSVHTDIIATTQRQVEAHLPDGNRKLIYANGQFLI